jgi:hypothetical protein
VPRAAFRAGFLAVLFFVALLPALFFVAPPLFFFLAVPLPCFFAAPADFFFVVAVFAPCRELPPDFAADARGAADLRDPDDERARAPPLDRCPESFPSPPSASGSPPCVKSPKSVSPDPLINSSSGIPVPLSNSSSMLASVREREPRVPADLHGPRYTRVRVARLVLTMGAPGVK